MKITASTAREIAAKLTAEDDADVAAAFTKAADGATDSDYVLTITVTPDGDEDEDDDDKANSDK